ncbi:ABC-three component system middle component 7 [Methanospirillum lacunae]|uniref:ABC-three component system middle component 7 n=1 Tax=Methanospirillum lacunae TaxID=668570 RepID=UPI0015E86A9D|nr:ABC-three component system middle component 7 [Methanospirillum lacunae]
MKESVIWKLPYIIEELNKAELNINVLYDITESKFTNINEFIFCLDILFILDKIEFLSKSRVIRLVS